MTGWITARRLQWQPAVAYPPSASTSKRTPQAGLSCSHEQALFFLFLAPFFSAFSTILLGFLVHVLMSPSFGDSASVGRLLYR